MVDAYLYAASRTPFGRFGGALADIRADDLAAAALTAVLAKVPEMPPELIGDVVWGCGNQAGEDNRNVGRMAGLLAGLPTSVPATTVNRLCGSSLDATMSASRAVECGDVDIAVAGGVESMTRAPWVMPKPDRQFPAGDITAVSTTLGWRLVNPAMPAEWTASLGECNELLGEKFSISRQRQDEFAARSHRTAHEAWEGGHYDDIVSPTSSLARDESIRPDTTVETLSTLRTSFRSTRAGGTITAGNASPLNDGAAALVVGSTDAPVGVDPLARIAGRGAHAVTPLDFGLAPIEAAQRALERAGITWADVGAVELNEAFAVQSLVCVDEWLKRGLPDPDMVNNWGGAIALGHPLGASGARIVGTLAHRLRVSGERWGVAAICIGVGQGLAIVLENVTSRNGR